MLLANVVNLCVHAADNMQITQQVQGNPRTPARHDVPLGARVGRRRVGDRQADATRKRVAMAAPYGLVLQSLGLVLGSRSVNRLQPIQQCALDD